jgi:hypothetical protein
MKLLFRIFLIPFLLPLLAHSQDTSKIANELLKMAHPETAGISGKEARMQSVLKYMFVIRYMGTK